MRNKRVAQTFLALVVAGTVFSAGEGFVVNADEVAQASSINTLAKSLTKENFVSVISPISKQIANENNLYPSLMVAQALLESYYGQSTLTQEANNLFGIKSFDGKGYVIDTTEYINGRQVTVKAVFKRYNNLMESLEDYAYFLNTPRYANVHRSIAKNGLEAARNVQRDGYATDPIYAKSLIEVIKNYNLTSLDDVSNVTPKPKELAKASYNGGNYNESFRLTHHFKNYRLYGHVKDTRDKNKTYEWRNSAKTGSLVYVDMKAVRSYKGKNSDWYRIRFSKNGRKYWVYNKAIGFPSFNYKNENHRIYVHRNNLGAYDNVFNTRNLAREVANADQIKTNTYESSDMATYVYHGHFNTWYRISINGRDAWISGKNVSVKKPVVKHKKVVKRATHKKKVTHKKHAVRRNVAKKHVAKKNVVKKYRKYHIKKGATYNKFKGFAYLNRYGRYDLNNHIPGATKHLVKTPWNKVKVPKNYRVRINLKGTRMKYNTEWYRIRFGNHNYWISGKALSFR